MACPDADTLVAFIAGEVDEPTRERVAAHLHRCERCVDTVGFHAAAFDSALSLPDRSEPQDTPEVFAGRYRIVECVGSGAGGVVFRAHDEELDRDVALKRVRRGWAPDEAKMMARVVHPNVVTVHDVGAADGEHYIATAFVHGGTLQAWLQQRRTRAEILRAFGQAGAGLAAIHDAGLVHRDFKPSNVMVGADGRLQVTDFGLARRGADRPGEPALVGTPAYMSPEQWRGEPADARSDQFSFCVALFEALWGARPFEGETPATLSAAVRGGNPRSAPASAPGWLARLVRRGLSVEPADRFPDMQALLDALRGTPRRLRTRRLAAVVGLGLLGAAVVGYASNPELDLCRFDEARLGGVWDARVRATLGERVGGQNVIAAVDAWLETWRAESGSACEAFRAEADGDTRAFELRVACLDRGFSALRAASVVLSSSDVPADRALAVAESLPAPDLCEDASRLELLEPTWQSAESRLLSRELAPELDRIRALRTAGVLDEARALAEDARRRADADGDPAVRAEVLIVLGSVLSDMLLAEEAEAVLRDAVWAAEASGDIETAAAGWIDLVKVLGTQRERYDEAERAAERAEAANLRLRDPERAVVLSSNRAVVANLQGDYERALQMHHVALAQAEETFGPEDPQVASIRHNMAAVLWKMGRLDEALAESERALEIHEAHYLMPHPTSPLMMSGVATLKLELGDTQGARAVLVRAIEIAEETLPPDSVVLGSLLSNLAMVEKQEGNPEAAAVLFDSILSIYRKVHQGPHPDIASALNNYAAVLEDLGQPEQAIAMLRESVAIYGDLVGPDHPRYASSQYNLGRVLTQEGQRKEGIEHLEHALEVRMAHAVDPYLRGTTTFTLAQAYDREGDREKALEHARRSAGYFREIAPRHARYLALIERWIEVRSES